MGRGCRQPEGRAGSVACWAFGTMVLCPKWFEAAGLKWGKIDQTPEGHRLGQGVLPGGPRN